MLLGVPQNVTPYCGTPPNPDDLWRRWNLDPVLILVLLFGVGLYVVALDRRSIDKADSPHWRRWAFFGGWITLTLALVSPLCPLSVSLFSARVGQHMVLSLVAAPMLILGEPGKIFGRLWPGFDLWQRKLSHFGTPLVATLGFALAIWFWHAPGPYDATFSSNVVYWLMHITIIGTALMIWSVLLDPSREGTVTVLAVGAISTLQMTFLGALITMTPHLLYAPHILTPYAWGLTQASDQQLGGLIMWVPGCSVFLGVTLYSLAKIMAERARPAALA
ncbi:MAG: cytochrome c oxidase assembly protein [Caulobacteraceae bacterium]